MQRYGLPIVIALLVGVAFIAFRGFGGDEEPDLPVELEPLAVVHSSESGLMVQVVNNSENLFDGDVRVRVVQGSLAVTTSFRLEVVGFGVGEGEVEGEWVTGDGSPAFELVIDPQGAVDDIQPENNRIAFTCPAPDAACTIGE